MANITLNQLQKEALEQIRSSRKSLLYGVTGSGKTEVYQSIIEDTLKKDKNVLLLIPEIALTIQTTHRLEKIFPTVVWHSQITPKKKKEIIHTIKKETGYLIIGTRSSLFLPIKNLGAIIIDEEHDYSYKQETNPRYHAVKCAEYLADNLDIPLVLGSATPSIETAYTAWKNANMAIVTLKERFYGEMPDIETINLRDEYGSGKNHFISTKLLNAMKQTLFENEQVMLFLNRRGWGHYVQCETCGHVEMCPRCDVSLTPHHDNLLRCHYCGYKKNIIQTCSECTAPTLKFQGVGLQKVANYLQKAFPDKTIIRMDTDTTKNKEVIKQMYHDFKDKKAHILIGTQIVKGFDFPNVKLVGIISADDSINFPEFRSVERTFQLLMQAAGRAGRREKKGKVIIQTYQPTHPIFKFIKSHNYKEFFTYELEQRKELNYPPFSRLLRIIISGKNKEKVITESEKIYNALQAEEKYLPTPALIEKLHNKLRYTILCKNPKKVPPPQRNTKDFSIVYDYDPISFV
ncbi:primosomal protein N' [Candidatus Margulisiibacteriota bacterium]